MEEKMMVLEMVGDSKITAADAQKLLQTLENDGIKSKGSSAEKLMILNMLGDLKITVGEAQRLLQALNGNERENFESARDESTRRARSNTNGANGIESENIGFDGIANNISKKIEVLAKDFEPKLKEVTGILVNATSKAKDVAFNKLSKMVAEEQQSRGSTAGRSTAGTVVRGDLKENAIEVRVTDNNSELNITGMNGAMSIKGYNGDKISVKVCYKERRENAKIDVMKLGNKYILSYDENEFEFVRVEGYVPEKMFEYVKIINSNAGVEIDNIQTNEIIVEGSNGQMKVENVKAKRGFIDNANAGISGSNLEIEELRLTNFNSLIRICNNGFRSFKEYNWEVETSNSSLELALPADSAYHIRGETSLSNVRVGLTNMNYTVNESTVVETKSMNFDSSAVKVRMNLETSNGPIIIN